MTITERPTEASFLDRRLARRFRTYDDNGNGFIEKADFEAAVARLGEEFGHGPDSPPRQKLLELSLGVWERMLEVADTNKDGKISVDEYKDAFKKGLLETPEDFEAVYTRFLNAIMDIIDADKDGKLTAEDEVRWTRALMHLPEEHAREAFRRMDKDRDGFITTQDLVDNIRGYYFDESENSPGYWLLGPLD